jgi:HK97 family phage portal protein
MRVLGFDLTLTRAPPVPAPDARNSPENPSTPLSNPAAWLWNALGASPASSGVNVTEQNALSIATLWACVRLISESIGSLPFALYRRTPDGRELVPGPLTRLVGIQPNPVNTSMTLREAMQAHSLTTGNGYSFIERDGATRPKGLYLLNPYTTWGERVARDRTVYHTTLEGGERLTLGDYDVLHLMGLSGDGINGYSVVRVLRETLGLAMATQEYGSRFFSGDATAQGVLEVPQILDDDGYRRIRQDWREAGGAGGGGLSSAHQVRILEQGTKYHQISIPPDDAQFLETRAFQRTDIAAAFRCPPHMVGITEGAANRASAEQLALEFVKFALTPWLVRWEQECYRKLLPDGETERYFKFNVDGLLRGDFASRIDAYSKGRQWGWWNVNDIKRMEDEQSIGPEGDIYLSPVNMVPADQAYDVIGSDAESGASTDAGGDPDAARKLLPIVEASCQRLADREAEALEKAIRRYLPNDPAGFDNWFETFATRHAANVQEALGIDGREHVEEIRAQLAAPGGLESLENWRERQAARLLERST